MSHPKTATATTLGKLGAPTEVAAEAGAERWQHAPPMGPRDTIAVVLLLIGGVALPFTGWLVGAILLWTSRAWSRKDKLIATLLVPGGLLGAVLLAIDVLGIRATSVTCPVPQGNSPQAIAPTAAHTATLQGCASGSRPNSVNIMMAALMIVAVGGPLFSTWWLVHHGEATRTLSTTTSHFPDGRQPVGLRPE